MPDISIQCRHCSKITTSSHAKLALLATCPACNGGDDWLSAPCLPPQSEWRDATCCQSIINAAERTLLAAIEYEKITPPEAGVRKSYVVEPYSFCLRQPRRSNFISVWHLIAFDAQDNHLKAFIVRNILCVEVMDQLFTPRWKPMIPRLNESRRRGSVPLPLNRNSRPHITFVSSPFEE